jgi:hypothetical protein
MAVPTGRHHRHEQERRAEQGQAAVRGLRAAQELALVAVQPRTAARLKQRAAPADLVQEAVVDLAVAPAGPVAVVDLRRVPNTGT